MHRPPIAGPALGGLCIARFGLGAAYVVDVVSFLVSLLALAGMRAMPPAPEAARPGLRSIAEGLRYARSRPEILGTYFVDIVAMTFAMPMALFPALSQPWGGARAAGWLYSGMSIGALAITVFSGWTGRVRRHGAAVVIAAAVWGVAVVALGYAPNLVLAVLCLCAAGGADMVSGIFRMTIWNETIPGHLRGRLAGVEMISYMTGPLLGNARAGWMATQLSNRASIVGGGAVCVVGVLLCIRLLPAFWHYRRPARAGEEPQSLASGDNRQ
jgi:MFS family permease